MKRKHLQTGQDTSVLLWCKRASSYPQCTGAGFIKHTITMFTPCLHSVVLGTSRICCLHFKSGSHFCILQRSWPLFEQIINMTVSGGSHLSKKTSFIFCFFFRQFYTEIFWINMRNRILKDYQITGYKPNRSN